MAFRQSTYNLARFNSAASSEFLNFYQKTVIDRIVREGETKPSRLLSPSSFRCDRRCWFKVRGVEPDIVINPDPVNQFKADIGTICHEIVQRNLVESLKVDWIDPEDYFKEFPPPWKYKLERNLFECRVEVEDPPFRFSCDGIIRWKDKFFLLEIKTIEYSAFENMSDPRGDHIDQVQCYATLLNLSDVLFLYIDRTFGNTKCYEVAVSDKDKQNILDKVNRILLMKEQNLAPSRLPKGDSECDYCYYKSKCKKYG